MIQVYSIIIVHIKSFFALNIAAWYITIYIYHSFLA